MPEVHLKNAPELESELGYYKMKFYRLYQSGKVMGFIQDNELYFDPNEVKEVILKKLEQKVKGAIPSLKARKIKLSWTLASLGKAEINLSSPTKASGKNRDFSFDTKSYSEQDFIENVKKLLKLKAEAYFPDGR